MMLIRSLLAAGAIAALGACSTPFSFADVHPGDARADVEARFGAPSAVYAQADGRARLQYQGFRFGQRNYNVDLDAAGRVARVEQTRDENHFLAMRAGMTEAEVLREIGPPNGHGHFTHPAEAETWIYRFETIQKCVVFELPFDVVTHLTQDGGTFPPDKSCGRTLV